MKYKVIVMLCAITLMLGAAGCKDNTRNADNKTDVKQTEDAVMDKKETDKTSTGQENPEKALSEKNSDQEDSNEKTSNQKNSSRQVVVSGYQLTLSDNISPQVTDQGLVLTDEEMNYQMLVTVRDYAFDSKKKTPEFFSEKVSEAGYEITKEPEITTVSDREFAYFTYVEQEDQMLLAYSGADKNHTFAALILRYGELEDKEFLKETAEILKSAEKTDLPDTTQDDISGWNEANAKGENNIPKDAVKVDTVAVSSGEKKITVSVPEDFYLLEGSNESSKIFLSADGTVNAYLYGLEELADSNLEDWVKDNVNVPKDAKEISKSEIMQEEAEGNTVYYQVVSYEEKSSYKEEMNTYLELVAICRQPDGICLELKADSSKENGLNFDMVKEFFKGQSITE